MQLGQSEPGAEPVCFAVGRMDVDDDVVGVAGGGPGDSLAHQRVTDAASTHPARDVQVGHVHGRFIVQRRDGRLLEVDHPGDGVVELGHEEPAVGRQRSLRNATDGAFGGREEPRNDPPDRSR